MQRAVTDRLFSLLPNQDSPTFDWLSAWSKYLSPYDLNPLNINPLKDLIERFVDFEGLRADKRALFIAATNVQTGRLHIFPREKITAEAVMASACLPAVFRAVEIDGVPYWDGGYLGNPVLYPFFRTTNTEDVLIVQINPLVRKKVPTSTREIVARVNEITFNSSLLSELRAIEFVNRLIEQRRLPHGTGPHEYRRIRVHRIVLEGLGERFSSATKLRNDYKSFELLRKLGQRSARRFLDAHYDDIGVRSSIDLAAEMLFDRIIGRMSCLPPTSAMRGLTSTSPTSPRSTLTPSSTPPTARCSAAAASTAPSTAPQGPACSTNAARSAAAPPAAPGSPAGIA